MSADLERSYRRALAWYPRSWRNRNADVVVGTLLDVAEAEHRIRPRRGELGGLAASGISTRLGVMLEPRACDTISTIALATGAAYPLAYFAFQLWSPSGLAHAPAWMFSAVPGLHPIVNPGLIIAAVWLLALVLALLPGRYGLRSIIVLAMVASVALIGVNRLPGAGAEWYGLTTTTMIFLALLAALTLIGTPARAWRLLRYSGVAFGAFLSAFILIALQVAAAPLDEHALWAPLLSTVLLLLVLAAFAAVTLAVRGRTAPAQTIVISALPWAIQLTRSFSYTRVWEALVLTALAAVLVAFGALLPLVFRREIRASLKESNKL